ncbi:MAG: outer membrane beta-barrel protein [Candidatus Zixiibacteriota bacterium]
MKKVLFTLGLLLLCVTFASAQVSKPFSAYVGGGLSLPQGDYADFYKTGYHGMGSIGFGFMPMLQGLGKVEYHSFPVDADLVSNDISVIMYGLDAKLSPSMPAAPIKPFALAGIGLATLKTDITLDLSGLGTGYAPVDVGTAQTTEFYYEIGGGFEMKATPSLNLFVMARYITVTNSLQDFNYLPVTVGLKF